MKLIRFGPAGQEKPGLLSVSGARKDCSELVEDWNGPALQGGSLKRVARLTPDQINELPDVYSGARWAAPVARPGKLIGIGLNYRDHAAESGAEVPTEPVVFMKATNCVAGPFDTVLIPRKSRKTDWEVELAIVIGTEARYLNSPEQARQCIAGYCICNDVSEREFQAERCGLWDKGKSCDTFAPLGPWVATPDEVKDVMNLPMTLRVNGVTKQQGNTSTMVFDVFFLVHYLSQFMTLEPGDVITTGTPPGVGMGRKPQEFLKAGDMMELSIEGLGAQRLVCADA